ncbi:MAG: GMC family oxidoreductase [Myxococcota bacterium]|nr:GMC family oxidoreductase [Myxococcota bacterium]
MTATPRAEETLRADAVVVGTGAGGGPAAAALAEAGLEVVVLEAGPRLEARDFEPDEWTMRTRLGRVHGTGDALQTFYAGACVGGSTVVNDALCWRPPVEVLDAWRRDHGLAEIRPERFARHVEAAWRDVNAQPTLPPLVNRNARALARGAEALGWANGAIPRNVRGCAGLGRCNLGCPLDAKQSTLVSYVPRAERAGARVVANASAERVRIEAGRAVGVDARRLDPETGRPAGTLRVEAPRVVLAAGALGTAPLLLRSGLGGAVGRGFTAHSSVYVTARFREPVHGYFGPTMAWAVSEWSDVNGHGGPGYMLENAAVRPLQTAGVLPGIGAAHERAMSALPHLAHTVVVLRDRTQGRIGVDARGAPVVDYMLAPADLERLRDAIGQAARAYLAAGAEEVWLPIHGSDPVRTEADLAPLAARGLDRTRLTLLYAVHLFGGAGMGGDRAASVCDPRGAVWGVGGLHVTDAAALPTNTGVNPQITIMANALRVAEGIA